MAEYGVVTTGFNRKPMDQIITELRSSAEDIFGPGIIVDHESPMGQIIGLSALLASQLWELAEDTYQSYDPDQAEGVRLDALARLRLISRATDELDVSLRQGITNAGLVRTDISDLRRALFNISGVTYVQLFVNDTDDVDDNGIIGHSVAVAIVGGDDDEVAAVVRKFIVPGIGTYGNSRIDTTIDGLCRTIWIVRPVPVGVLLRVTVRTFQDKMGCPPPSTSAIIAGLMAELSGDRMLVNGDDITDHAIRTAIECRWPNVEYVSATAAYSVDLPVFVGLPLAIEFFEIASFDANGIVVTVE